MISLQAENQRLNEHFVRVGKLVTENDTSHLDAAQQLVRELLIAEVARYGRGNQFPRNHDSEALRPTFIDAQGTPCAMAHLLQFGGAGELASRIAQESNHAYVPQLAERPEFAEWLSAAGITVEEAAAIQPGYGCTSPAGCVCGESFGNQAVVPAKAVLQVVVESQNTARVEQVYGQTSWRVGDVVSILGGLNNQRMIIGIGEYTAASTGTDGGTPFQSQLFLNAGDKFSCAGQGVSGTATPITTETYAKAVMASDCKATLIQLEPSYSANPCGLGSAGCSTTVSNASPASIGILLAIAGVLLARRIR